MIARVNRYRVACEGCGFDCQFNVACYQRDQNRATLSIAEHIHDTESKDCPKPLSLMVQTLEANVLFYASPL